jgi:hypothetical protein
MYPTRCPIMMLLLLFLSVAGCYPRPEERWLIEFQQVRIGISQEETVAIVGEPHAAKNMVEFAEGLDEVLVVKAGDITTYRALIMKRVWLSVKETDAAASGGYDPQWYHDERYRALEVWVYDQSQEWPRTWAGGRRGLWAVQLLLFRDGRLWHRVGFRGDWNPNRFAYDVNRMTAKPEHWRVSHEEVEISDHE